MKGGMARRSRPPILSRHAPRYGVPIFTFVLVVVTIGLVAISPLALDLFGNNRAWATRSEIGQTYGAAAALISVLALVGISFSLILQAREAKAAREHASRVTHSELLRMAMENPAYRECWGPLEDSLDETEQQQQIYTNLILSYWQSRFEVGMFSEAHLRAGGSDMFAAAPGRRFWAETRQVRRATAQTRRARRFHAILDEEYEAAVASGAPKSRQRPPVRRPAGRRFRALVLAAAGLIAATRLVCRALGRRRP